MGFLGFGGPDQDELDRYERYRQEDQARQDKEKAEMDALREKKRTSSLDLLGQMTGPQQTDAQKNRIAALEEESKIGPLSQDALFQGDRANLVQGGQQALSSVQNTQRAAGTSGGFSNQGSIQDVYDRLGAQMAQLGQASRQVKEQKRDTAAELQQSFVDAQLAFTNAQTKAKMAIEQGDADAAAQYLQQAYEARQAIEQTYRAQTKAAQDRAAAQQAATIGAIAKLGGSAIGAAAGGPAGAKTGGEMGDAVGSAAGGGASANYFNQSYQMPPYSQLRGR